MKKSEYLTMKGRQQDAFNRFFERNGFAAFTKDQFRAGMKGLGLDPSKDVHKIADIGNGMFLLKSKVDEYTHMAVGFERELANALKDDEFFVDAVAEELANHEYIVRHDPFDTLDALGLTEHEVFNDPRMSKLFKRAEDRYYGIEGIEITDTNRYFIEVRKSDYTYGPDDAIKEFLSENPDVAQGIAQQYWADSGDDSEPFDWDYFEDLLSTYKPIDAFWAGYYSNEISPSDDMVYMDAYGHFHTLSDHEFEKLCYETATDSACIEKILSGEIDIPPDMAEIVGLFMFDPEELSVSHCVKSRHALKSKSVKTKKKVPAKKKIPAKRKPTVKPTTNPNKRPPTPKKKPEVKRTSDKKAAPKKVTKRTTVKTAPARNKTAPKRSVSNGVRR